MHTSHICIRALHGPLICAPITLDAYVYMHTVIEIYVIENPLFSRDSVRSYRMTRFALHIE